MTEPFDPDELHFKPDLGVCYAVPVEYEGENRWMLCDDDGDPLVISSMEMIRTVALEAGLVLCSRH